MIFLTGFDHYHDKVMMPAKPPARIVQDLRFRLMKSVRIVDLDGAIVPQASFLEHLRTEWTSALDWGPHLRWPARSRTSRSLSAGYATEA